jgi:hypothetical protein
VLGPVCRTTDPRDETIPLAWAQVMVRVVEPDWAMALVDTHAMARVMRMDFMLQLPLIVACPPNKLNSAQFRYGTCRNNASRRAKGVKAMLHGNVAGGRGTRANLSCQQSGDPPQQDVEPTHGPGDIRQQVVPVHRAP